MTTQDEKIPPALLQIQNWFADVITQPIDQESRINPIAPSGITIEKEAPKFIVPSPTLQPWQRIQIYNQQYWWRLLGVLQDTYALTVRLFGYREFNEKIAIPYLVKHPPHHWSLDALGDHLPEWVHDAYHENDKPLISEAVAIDHAFNHAFTAAEYTPINRLSVTKQSDFSELLNQKVFLQPHLHLFKLTYDLFPFRAQMLDESPDYWVDHDFPPLDKEGPYYYALYRNEENMICWKTIAQGEHALLHRFRNGTTIEKACQWLEKQDDQLYNEAAEKLHIWFQEWTIRHWLGIPEHD
ncbi:MAG: putative DNA-binding domain-containing protein [Chlamydiales bacterium]|nr:putative DNA-binding domain-containing protein [Chlamydiia bacterium]MCP5507419.1 putative DNA-binding domain-containing protein [Chlamydiales bacterium]